MFLEGRFGVGPLLPAKVCAGTSNLGRGGGFLVIGSGTGNGNWLEMCISGTDPPKGIPGLKDDDCLRSGIGESFLAPETGDVVTGGGDSGSRRKDGSNG